MFAAAFGRLCVETPHVAPCIAHQRQPPSGGCVLKHNKPDNYNGGKEQPPSGGCVLKLDVSKPLSSSHAQPPSGGCVLKRFLPPPPISYAPQPPSGGCVLKRLINVLLPTRRQAAAFGRLCVETSYSSAHARADSGSRLRAAVC